MENIKISIPPLKKITHHFWASPSPSSIVSFFIQNFIPV